MQQSESTKKVILPNVQIYNNDCWLQCVVLLCYHNNNNYNRIINYKGDIPFLIHLRNFFNEVESLKFLYQNKYIKTQAEFYNQLAKSMLLTTEQLKDDAVIMSQIFSNSGDWYNKNSFYNPYDCINAINKIFIEENGGNQGIIDINKNMGQEYIRDISDIYTSIALNESIGQNVTFFYLSNHWTTAIRNKDGKFLYYDNMRPYKSDGNIYYFDGEQMQKYYIWDINKLMSICPNKENNQKEQSSKKQVQNLKNYYPNNQIMLS